MVVHSLPGIQVQSQSISLPRCGFGSYQITDHPADHKIGDHLTICISIFKMSHLMTWSLHTVTDTIYHLWWARHGYSQPQCAFFIICADLTITYSHSYGVVQCQGPTIFLIWWTSWALHTVTDTHLWPICWTRHSIQWICISRHGPSWSAWSGCIQSQSAYSQWPWGVHTVTKWTLSNSMPGNHICICSSMWWITGPHIYSTISEHGPSWEQVVIVGVQAQQVQVTCPGKISHPAPS